MIQKRIAHTADGTIKLIVSTVCCDVSIGDLNRLQTDIKHEAAESTKLIWGLEDADFDQNNMDCETILIRCKNLAKNLAKNLTLFIVSGIEISIKN